DEQVGQLAVCVLLRFDEALLRFFVELSDLAADFLIQIDGLLAEEDREAGFALRLPVKHQTLKRFPFHVTVPDLTCEAKGLLIVPSGLHVLPLAAKGAA